MNILHFTHKQSASEQIEVKALCVHLMRMCECNKMAYQQQCQPLFYLANIELEQEYPKS